MGFSPAQVDDMTLFQFSAAVAGYRAANATGSTKGPDLSTDAAEALARDLGLEGVN